MTVETSEGRFEDLAAGSLPTLGGDPLLPSWSRSLTELMAANQALIAGVSEQPSAAAQVLLGSRTDFGTLASTLEAPKSHKVEAFASVAETCRKNRDGIIERILQKEREHTQKTLEKALQRQLEEDWARERDWWMKEIVGTRNLVDSTNSLVTRPADIQLGAILQALPGPSHNLLVDAYTSRANALDPDHVRGHLEIVESITSSSDVYEMCTRFEKCATYSSGYCAAWQLLSCMLPRRTSAPAGAQGALIHFCRQYRAIIKTRVAKASLAGQDVSTGQNYGAGMGGTIAAYVKLEYGSSATIWHILYFCLRCGDAVAARDVLQMTSSTHYDFPEQPAVQGGIMQLCQTQGNASCLWESGTPIVGSRDRGVIVDLYEKTKNLESNNTHKIGVLALLAGKELASFSTIEDYLFSCLWSALMHEDSVPKLEVVGASIRKYGPDHFGGEENGGWGYVLPLLASQQFKTSLLYLAEAGGPAGILQAVHLSLAFSQKGVPLDDLGREVTSGCLVTALLVRYASLLEAEASAGAPAALHYFLRIPSKDQSRREIAAMVARSPHLVDQLVGTLNDDGGRQSGELDKHLEKMEISLLVSEAAEIVRKQSTDLRKAEFAAKLFMLAGRFGSLLNLLNDLMSPTDQDDQTKRYWCDQSQMFYTTYLTRRTLVLASLESGNEKRLVSTNRTLIELRFFFEQVRNEQFQEGLDIINRLDLLPLNPEEINEKHNKYKDLDPVLKDQFPSLLKAATQCLYGLHFRLRSESRGKDQNAEDCMHDLQKKARCLFMFSGFINMPSSTKTDITRMRNHMI